jgi:hypothetical protein
MGRHPSAQQLLCFGNVAWPGQHSGSSEKMFRGRRPAHLDNLNCSVFFPKRANVYCRIVLATLPA